MSVNLMHTRTRALLTRGLVPVRSSEEAEAFDRDVKALPPTQRRLLHRAYLRRVQPQLAKAEADYAALAPDEQETQREAIERLRRDVAELRQTVERGHE